MPTAVHDIALVSVALSGAIAAVLLGGCSILKFESDRSTRLHFAQRVQEATRSCVMQLHSSCTGLESNGLSGALQFLAKCIVQR